MNIVDIVIILFLVLGAIVGAKKGFTSQLVDTVGTIAIIVLSFLLKGMVSNIFYEYLPFFEFSGKLEGITSLNLLLYEVIAFVLLIAIFSSILKVIKLTTSAFEQLLKMTIVLGIPSQILGAIVGLIQNFILTFVTLYFLSLPVFHMDIIKESSLSSKILNSTPGLTQICSDSLEVFEDFDQLLEEYKEEPNRDIVNQETLQLLIERHIVDEKTANGLIARGKLKGLQAIIPEE